MFGMFLALYIVVLGVLNFLLNVVEYMKIREYGCVIVLGVFKYLEVVEYVKIREYGCNIYVLLVLVVFK